MKFWRISFFIVGKKNNCFTMSDGFNVFKSYSWVQTKLGEILGLKGPSMIFGKVLGRFPRAKIKYPRSKNQNLRLWGYCYILSFLVAHHWFYHHIKWSTELLKYVFQSFWNWISYFLEKLFSTCFKSFYMRYPSISRSSGRIIIGMLVYLFLIKVYLKFCKLHLFTTHHI